MGSMERVKRFWEWIVLKEKLNDIEKEAPLVNEREIWWVSFGENIGSEIGGKSSVFTRPGLILKKLSRGFFLVAPTTSKEKSGSWYVPVTLEGEKTHVCLHQIRTVDYRRFFSLRGRLDTHNFKSVKEAFWKLYR